MDAVDSGCCDFVEPCHNGECDGFDEVVDLLPKGGIWDTSRESTYSQYVKALGHIKTELNKMICQEWVEMDPCRAVRLFGYWAELFKFPTCVDQTNEKLCEWIDLIYDETCPIGSQGFLRKAIEFVAPDLTFDLQFNLPDTCGGLAHCWQSDNVCVDQNQIIITVDANDLFYERKYVDFPFDGIDLVDPCKFYFIPEVNCIRHTIFPMGLGVGYRTTVSGPNNEPIFGVPETNTAVNTRFVRHCHKEEPLCLIHQ